MTREPFVKPTETEIRASVKERIAEWEAAPETRRDVLALAGSWKYGLPNSPAEEQVANAIRFWDCTIGYCCCCGGYVHTEQYDPQPDCNKHLYCNLCMGRGHNDDHDCADYEEKPVVGERQQ